MLVQATRTLSALTLRALFYAVLFGVVVLAHLAITGALRAQGWGGGLSLLVSGAAVLVLVLVLTNVAEWVREWLAARREMQRLRQGLPAGPCCVVWRTPEGAAATPSDEDDNAMPWELADAVRARYPRLARRLGVEGVAIAEFEVSTEGRAKNVHCVDAWPSDVFFNAAREALLNAKFQPKDDVHVRYGASYRMPFVFRIAGAAKLKEPGRRARKLRPGLQKAAQAMEKIRRTG